MVATNLRVTDGMRTRRVRYRTGENGHARAWVRVSPFRKIEHRGFGACTLSMLMYELKKEGWELA